MDDLRAAKSAGRPNKTSMQVASDQGANYMRDGLMMQGM